jgi:hypothetical protein
MTRVLYHSKFFTIVMGMRVLQKEELFCSNQSEQELYEKSSQY